jgi:hypothetical protein
MGDINFDKASVGNVSSGADALSVTNTGTGDGVASISINGRGVTGNGGIAGVFGGSPTGEGVLGQSGGGVGVRGDSENNSGVHGESINEDGVSGQGGRFGVSGSGGKAGVFGSSSKNGIHGKSTSQTDSGVRAENTGGGYGVRGITNSEITPRDTNDPNDPKIHAGVWGENQGDGYGIKGTSSGPLGGSVGVYGHSAATGVYGNGGNSGVLGFGGNIGVSGDSAKTGVQGNGTNIGVAGRSAKIGVYGNCNPTQFDVPSAPDTNTVLKEGGYGVVGTGQNGGVIGLAGDVKTNIGVSTPGAGVVGASKDGIGIIGHCLGINPNAKAVFGLVENASSGVPGKGLAGYFSGNVQVTGNLQKAGGGFKIDHPQDPANKYLNHSFVESPDMKNIYDGVAQLDAHGEAMVELPKWFEVLNKDFRYQLTCIGGFAPVYIAEKISKDRFKIAGGQPHMEVSWQVTGIRQDIWARANPMKVEEDKLLNEREYYLHPELYNYTEEQGISWATQPEVMRRFREPLHDPEGID